MAARAADATYLLCHDHPDCRASQLRGNFAFRCHIGFPFSLPITEGLQIVERQMRERTVREGEEELFKHQARERDTAF